MSRVVSEWSGHNVAVDPYGLVTVLLGDSDLLVRMTPIEARELAAELLAAADRAEAGRK